MKGELWLQVSTDIAVSNLLQLWIGKKNVGLTRWFMLWTLRCWRTSLSESVPRFWAGWSSYGRSKELSWKVWGVSASAPWGGATSPTSVLWWRRLWWSFWRTRRIQQKIFGEDNLRNAEEAVGITAWIVNEQKQKSSYDCKFSSFLWDRF